MSWSLWRAGGGVYGGWTGWLIVSLNRRHHLLSSYLFFVSLSAQTCCSYGNLLDASKWLKNVDQTLLFLFAQNNWEIPELPKNETSLKESSHEFWEGLWIDVGQSATTASAFCFWHLNLKYMTHSPSKWKLNTMPPSIYSVPFSEAPGNFWRLNVQTWSLLDGRPLSPVCLTACSPQPENRIISLQTCGFSVWTPHLSGHSLQ